MLTVVERGYSWAAKKKTTTHARASPQGLNSNGILEITSATENSTSALMKLGGS